MILPPDEVATVIKARRLALGWSKNELARRLGVDGQTVSRWEEGAGDQTAYRFINFAFAGSTNGDDFIPREGADIVNEQLRRRTVRAELAVTEMVEVIRRFRNAPRDNRSDGVDDSVRR